MERIKINIDRYRAKPTKKLAAFEFQDAASKAIKILHTPPRYISQVFKFYKKDRIKAEQSLRYIQERNDIHTPTRYFIYLMTH